MEFPLILLLYFFLFFKSICIPTLLKNTFNNLIRDEELKNYEKAGVNKYL